MCLSLWDRRPCNSRMRNNMKAVHCDEVIVVFHQRPLFPLLGNSVFQQWPLVLQVAYRRRKKTRQTAMDGPIRCSLLTLEREEHPKPYSVIHRAIILLAVLYRCETWPLILSQKEDHKLRWTYLRTGCCWRLKFDHEFLSQLINKSSNLFHIK
jgi:hypothetical protein